MAQDGPGTFIMVRENDQWKEQNVCVKVHRRCGVDG